MPFPRTLEYSQKMYLGVSATVVRYSFLQQFPLQESRLTAPARPYTAQVVSPIKTLKRQLFFILYLKGVVDFRFLYSCFHRGNDSYHCTHCPARCCPSTATIHPEGCLQELGIRHHHSIWSRWIITRQFKFWWPSWFFKFNNRQFQSVNEILDSYYGRLVVAHDGRINKRIQRNINFFPDGSQIRAHRRYLWAACREGQETHHRERRPRWNVSGEHFFFQFVLFCVSRRNCHHQNATTGVYKSIGDDLRANPDLLFNDYKRGTDNVIKHGNIYCGVYCTF